MKYNIAITEQAEEMLDHILCYIFNQLKNPQASVNLIAEIELVYGIWRIMLECMHTPTIHFKIQRISKGSCSMS